MIITQQAITLHPNDKCLLNVDNWLVMKIHGSYWLRLALQIFSTNEFLPLLFSHPLDSDSLTLIAFLDVFLYHRPVLKRYRQVRHVFINMLLT